jgi:hypothetical protein
MEQPPYRTGCKTKSVIYTSIIDVPLNWHVDDGYQKEMSNMKTAEEIITYLEAEMNEAIELHDDSKDAAQRLSLMLKAYTISELLDVIKK